MGERGDNGRGEGPWKKWGGGVGGGEGRTMEARGLRILGGFVKRYRKEQGYRAKKSILRKRLKKCVWNKQGSRMGF